MIFEDFEKEYPPRESCVMPEAEAIRKYGRVLPPDLIGKWREAGWCSYGNGLLWMVDPQQLNDVLEEFVDLKGDKPVVFLRTAFAHLYFWHGGFVHSLDVHGGSVSQVTEDVAEMFTLLCHPRMKEKILRVSLFEQARQELGDLDRDECYAFEPALALGGPGTVDTIRRVTMREHLAILAQLNQ
jgi:hypothetical protein